MEDEIENENRNENENKNGNERQKKCVYDSGFSFLLCEGIGVMKKIMKNTGAQIGGSLLPWFGVEVFVLGLVVEAWGMQVENTCGGLGTSEKHLGQWGMIAPKNNEMGLGYNFR